MRIETAAATDETNALEHTHDQWIADRYEVRCQLAQGGVGVVYLAYDHHLEREVAIKRTLDSRSNHDLDETENLYREAKMLARLAHPNIVSLHDFGVDHGGPYLVTQVVHGDTLSKLIESAALTDTDFFEFVEQTLDPLVEAERIGLIHRDIKPSNLMLSITPGSRLHVYLLDFGLAKVHRRASTQTLDMNGQFLGSIDYLAPEQFEVKPLDQRTDLYSLGCVYYYSLTQQSPFRGETAGETMRNHLENRFLPLAQQRRSLPSSVASWVESLLARDPNDRPAGAHEALTAFQQCREAALDSRVGDTTKIRVIR
ncbi:MAG: serine/threonine-protein kinase [Verrucomicrobiota bacterium]